jgi:hypothetical protein
MIEVPLVIETRSRAPFDRPGPSSDSKRKSPEHICFLARYASRVRSNLEDLTSRLSILPSVSVIMSEGVSLGSWQEYANCWSPAPLYKAFVLNWLGW